MWPILSALLLLDAGRELRHRLGTLMLYSGMGVVLLLALLFALQSAQLALAGVISAPLASLVVAVCLLTIAGFTLLAIRLRQRQQPATGGIARKVLEIVPLGTSMLGSGNVRTVLAALVLAGAAVLGSRLARKR